MNIRRTLKRNPTIYGLYKRSPILTGLNQKYRMMRAKMRLYSYKAKHRRSVKLDGMKMLDKIENVLKPYAGHYFVDYGTLLGLIRDGKLISWDFDMDFGVFLDESFNWTHLEKAMNSIGMYLKHQFRFHGQLTEQTYEKGSLLVDFFLHTQDEDGSRSYVYARKEFKYENNQQMHATMLMSLPLTGTKEFDLKGRKVHIPIEAEDYLRDIYGSKWRIPDSHWNWKNSDCKPRYEFPDDDLAMQERMK